MTRSSVTVSDEKIPAELEQQLEAMRAKAKNHGQPVQWKPWQDKVLVKYWGIPGIGKAAISKMLGVGVSSCRRRYLELKDKKSI